MSNTTKTVLSIIIAVIVMIILLAVINFFSYRYWNREIDEINDTIETLEYQRDSLQKLVDVRESEIDSLQNIISFAKERIVYIKIRNNEKVDSVCNLPVDDAILFLSRELSKEADSGR